MDESGGWKIGWIDGWRNVPNESRIIMLSCTEISYLFWIWSQTGVFYFLTRTVYRVSQK